MWMPGFGGSGGIELNITYDLIETLIEQLAALRRGTGPKMGFKLDLNFNFKPDGIVQIGRALEDARERIGLVEWLEYDLLDPSAMRRIRDSIRIPVASLESLYGRVMYKPYLEAQAVDYAIVDVLWNGFWESMKIAALADIYHVNCASHNYHGWLGTAISAHFCAAIPNFKTLEVDVDDVPWKDEIVNVVPVVTNGVMQLPNRPGWGIDLNEAAIAEHPPSRSATTGMWSSLGQVPASDTPVENTKT